jgi:hypothetical protein
MKSLGWINTPIPLSVESVEAMQYILEVWDTSASQLIKPPRSTLLVVTDASESGGGGLVYLVIGGKPMTEMGEVNESEVSELQTNVVAMDMADAVESSTYREALVLEAVLRKIPQKHLHGAVLEGVTDNMGLANRYWMGSTTAMVSKVLMRIARFLKTHEATWKSMRWVPREMTTLKQADALSRMLGDPRRATVSLEWFEDWIKRTAGRKRPNIDAFCEPENCVFRRLKEGEALKKAMVVSRPTLQLRYDGAAQRWKHFEIPWMFPPTALITAAVTNWKESKSTLAYVCVPAFALSHNCLRSLDTVIPFRVEKPVVQGVVNEEWEWMIYRLKKP